MRNIMENKRSFAIGVAVLIIVIVVLLFLFVKNNGNSKEKEYEKLIADLCDTTLELYKKGENAIVINEDIVGDVEYVTFETISLLTIDKNNSVPMKIEDPRTSKRNDPVYFKIGSAIKLVVNNDKKVICEGYSNIGTSPILTLKGENIISIKLNEEFVDPGYTAIDEEDGDITSKVLKNGIVDTKTKGEYNLLYFIEDSMGNKEYKTRKIIVE